MEEKHLLLATLLGVVSLLVLTGFVVRLA